MSTVDKPRTGGKESVTYFGNRVRMMDNWFLMKGFGCFMKESAKMLMVFESNIKAIRPLTAALLYLLIELRLNGPVNNISVMRDRERLKGPYPIQICHKSSKSRPIITIKVKIYFNIISVMPMLGAISCLLAY